jgi:hypothetical protein
MDGINDFSCGILEEDGSTYKEECPTGFSGDLCDYELDECASNPCNNNECTNDISLVDEYECECSAYYTGDNCLINKDEDWFKLTVTTEIYLDPYDLANKIKSSLGFFMTYLNMTGNITLTNEQYNTFTSISSVDTCFNGCASISDRFQVWEDDDFGGDNVTGYTIAVQTGDLTDQIITVFESQEFKDDVGIDFDSNSINVYESGSWIPYALGSLGGVLLCCCLVFLFFMFRKKQKSKDEDLVERAQSMGATGLELG